MTQTDLELESGNVPALKTAQQFCSRKCSRKICCCSTFTCAILTPLITYFTMAILWGIIGSTILWKLSAAWGHQQFDPWSTDAATFVITPQHGIPSYEWWPGCQGEKDGVDPTDRNPSGAFYKRFRQDPNDTSYFTNCGTSCCDCNEIPLYRTLQAKAGGFSVRIRSRKKEGMEDAVLSAWWLPAPDAGSNVSDSPVVIVQHGMKGSHKDGRPNMIAYLLRTAGFSVLLPSLRDHGSSTRTNHASQGWGYDYPLDILGAFDYVATDPDNKLGGPRPRSKIGILGLSMGSYAASGAFGLDGDIPALWVDGVITKPKDILVSVSPFTKTWAQMILPITWSVAKGRAPVDFALHGPENTLKTGPKTNRPVMVAGSTDDTNTPSWMMHDFIESVKDAGDGKYSVTKWEVTAGYCTGVIGGKEECSLLQEIGQSCTFKHNIMMWTNTQEYRQKLCDFWSIALLGTSCQAKSPEWYVMKASGVV